MLYTLNFLILKKSAHLKKFLSRLNNYLKTNIDIDSQLNLLQFVVNGWLNKTISKVKTKLFSSNTRCRNSTEHLELPTNSSHQLGITLCFLAIK